MRTKSFAEQILDSMVDESGHCGERGLSPKQFTVLTERLREGETLTLTKLGKGNISFGWYRRIKRVVYEAGDGSYWAWYDNRWNELASYVSEVDGKRHFCNGILRFAWEVTCE